MRRKVFALLTLIKFVLIAGFLSTCAFSLSGCTTSVTASSTAGRQIVNRHLHYTYPNIPLDQIMKEKKLKADDQVNLYIDLSRRTLYFRYGDETLKRYRIAAGIETSKGEKEKRGDLRTPKGDFYICSKAAYSGPEGGLGTRWMQLSYPNAEAAKKGLENNLITEKVYNSIIKAIENMETPPQNTPLGSGVGIHGGANHSKPRDWTAGCIGMYDSDIEEIYKYVKVGTKVVIE